MVFKYNIDKIYTTFLLILFQTYIIDCNYISIPFKIYTDDITGLISEEQFISGYITNKIYFPLKIGHPNQNILGTVNSMEFELLIKKGDFFIQNNNYIYDSQKSGSFSIISDKTISYFDSFDSNYVQENFNFCTEYDINERMCKSYKEYKINCILSKKSSIDSTEKDDIDKINFIEIGLNLKTHYGTKYSLFNNLIDNRYISSNTWFLFYFKNEENNEKDEGILVYGEDPLKLIPNKYNSSNIAYSQGINRKYDYTNYWSLIFNEVKLKSMNSKDEIFLGNNIQGVINHNYKVIVGSQKYLELIEEQFFWHYTPGQACKKNILNDKFYYYVCDSNILSMDEIKTTFPSIYMKQIDFNFIFELTPDDLFVTRGDKIFFLVVFNKNNPTNSFLLGSNFLKKYLFYFDNDKNQIAFLRDNTNKNGQNEVIVVHWYNSPGTVIILIILFLIIGSAGFYFGRKFYLKRKLRANELEDQFSYESSKDKKNGTIDLEMKLGL